VIRAALPARPEARRLLVGTLFWAVGTGMTLPFLYIYLHEVRHIDATVVGLVVAWMGTLSLLLAGPSGALMDRFGARRVLLPLYAVGAVGAVSWGFDHVAWQAFGSGTILALAGSTVFAGQNVILTSVTGEDERQRVFGLSFAVLNLGIGAGGVVAGFIADVHHPTSFQVLYLVNAISWLGPATVLLSMPKVGRRHPAAEAAGDDAGGYREVFANRAYRRLFVFSLLLFACGYAQIEIGLPAFATTVGHVSTRVIAWAFAVNTMTIVVGQLLVLRRLQGRSRSRALAVSAVVVAVSWAVLGIGGFGRSAGAFLPVVGVLVCTMIFASAETIFSPMLPALTNALAPDELRGRYNAMGSLVWGVTSVVGPLTAAPLIGHGLAGVWLALIIGGSLGAAVIALSLHTLLTQEQDGRASVDSPAERPESMYSAVATLAASPEPRPGG
jgi:MFS family permease